MSEADRLVGGSLCSCHNFDLQLALPQLYHCETLCILQPPVATSAGCWHCGAGTAESVSPTHDEQYLVDSWPLKCVLPLPSLLGFAFCIPVFPLEIKGECSNMVDLHRFIHLACNHVEWIIARHLIKQTVGFVCNPSLSVLKASPLFWSLGGITGATGETQRKKKRQEPVQIWLQTLWVYFNLVRACL